MAVIRRLHVPLKAPEDVISHLGKPSHWKEGRSAKCLVDQWWHANALPSTVARMLDHTSEWQGAELVDAYVERQTSLEDGRPSHSQSDLLAIVALENRLGIIAIEAKVDEGFDKTVSEWLGNDSFGKVRRLTKLCELLGISPDGIGDLRYQLLHRAASAILEAKRYRASQTAMIIQSWCPNASGFQDFVAFSQVVGMNLTAHGELTPSKCFNGVSLRIGWLQEAV